MPTRATRRPPPAAPLIVVIVTLACWAVIGNSRSVYGQTARDVALPPDPSKVMGVEFCTKCHKDAHAVWKTTAHASGFESMHRSDVAKRIAANLNLRSIKNSGRCDACHYLTQSRGESKPRPIAGVGCEACHGAAANWGLIHHDLGGPDVTRETETPEHRERRIRWSILAGMRTPRNVYLLAQSCYRCHLVADEELVMVGGHPLPPGGFNLVGWSQGSMRHNVVRYGKGMNQPSTQERQRVMFVAGLIAELEAGLRAVAVAQQSNVYSTSMAKITHRAGLKLAEINRRIDAAELDEIDRIFSAVELSLNQSEPLLQAADAIMTLGFQFAGRHDGTAFAALDQFIPTSNQWK